MAEEPNQENAGGNKSGNLNAPGRRGKKLAERYEESLAKSEKHSKKRLIVFFIVFAILIVFLIFVFTTLSNLYQKYKMETMLDDPESTPMDRERIFIKMVQDNSPNLEDVCYQMIDKGQDTEKEEALDILFQLGSKNLKDKCLSVWNNPYFNYNVRVHAFSVYYDLSTPDDYKVFFDAIGVAGGFPCAYKFYTEKADLNKVIKLAVEKSSSASIQDRINSVLSFRPIYDRPEFQNSSEAMSALIAFLSDNSPEVRVRALWTVSEMARLEFFDTLVNLLENDPDSDIRMYAARGLGNIKDPRAADALLPLLAAPESRINEAAGDALIQIGNASDSRDLHFRIIAAAKNVAENASEEGEIREYAVKVIGSFGYNEAVDILANLVKSANSKRVVMKAASLLGEIGSNRAIPALSEALEEMAGDIVKSDVRAVIVSALEAINDSKAVPALLKALDSPSTSRDEDETDRIGRALDKILIRKTEISSMISEREIREKVSALREKLGIE